MNAAKSTPMLRQYLAIKEQYPDAILFYRMGDFYEMFFQDAETASRVLEITLTSRNKNDESPVPMCGVPHRAAAGYIARLIERGFKVAVCDQVEDPAVAKGLVRREVVRVITPGMVIDEEFLDARSQQLHPGRGAQLRPLGNGLPGPLDRHLPRDRVRTTARRSWTRPGAWRRARSCCRRAPAWRPTTPGSAAVSPRPP